MLIQRPSNDFLQDKALAVEHLVESRINTNVVQLDDPHHTYSVMELALMVTIAGLVESLDVADIGYVVNLVAVVLAY